MTNKEKYINAFVEGMEIEKSEVENASVNSTEKWDSIGLMALIAIIEEDFEIQLEPEDIFNLKSYKDGIEVLKKHNIVID